MDKHLVDSRVWTTYGYLPRLPQCLFWPWDRIILDFKHFLWWLRRWILLINDAIMLFNKCMFLAWVAETPPIETRTFSTCGLILLSIRFNLALMIDLADMFSVASARARYWYESISMFPPGDFLRTTAWKLLTSLNTVVPQVLTKYSRSTLFCVNAYSAGVFSALPTWVISTV